MVMVRPYRCGRCGDTGHNARTCEAVALVDVEGGEVKCRRCPNPAVVGKKHCALCLDRLKFGYYRITLHAQERANKRVSGLCFVVRCDQPGWPLRGAKGNQRPNYCFAHLPRSHPERKKLCIDCTERPRARGWKTVGGEWREVEFRRCRKCWYKHESQRRRDRSDYDTRRRREGQLRTWRSRFH